MSTTRVFVDSAQYGKAVKNTITITIYTEEPLVDNLDEAEGFPFLDAAIYEMTYGSAVGSYEIGEPQVVEGEALRDGLIAIGNDGTFFEDAD
jgi:hypothetical protein